MTSSCLPKYPNSKQYLSSKTSRKTFKVKYVLKLWKIDICWTCLGSQHFFTLLFDSFNTCRRSSNGVIKFQHLQRSYLMLLLKPPFPPLRYAQLDTLIFFFPENSVPTADHSLINLLLTFLFTLFIYFREAEVSPCPQQSIWGWQQQILDGFLILNLYRRLDIWVVVCLIINRSNKEKNRHILATKPSLKRRRKIKVRGHQYLAFFIALDLMTSDVQ